VGWVGVGFFGFVGFVDVGLGFVFLGGVILVGGIKVLFWGFGGGCIGVLNFCDVIVVLGGDLWVVWLGWGFFSKYVSLGVCGF